MLQGLQWNILYGFISMVTLDAMNANMSPLKHPKLPLFNTMEDKVMDQPLAWRNGYPISRTLFLTHVNEVVNTLPDSRYAINLCDDRYSFMVAFAAALVAGQTNLLPHSRMNTVVASVVEEYPNSYCLVDSSIEGLDKPQHILADFDTDVTISNHSMPEIAETHVAAIAFTSGSTGRPHPNPKMWGQLVSGANLAQERFNISHRTNLVVTVPPQHMYGLETSILLPLISGACVHAGRPFYPEDIRLWTKNLHDVRNSYSMLRSWRYLVAPKQAQLPVDVPLMVTFGCHMTA
jgi:acyl-CoA synthetase (AMP-forming)/AMP-acid ligase II